MKINVLRNISFFTFLFSLFTYQAEAQSVIYEKADSLKVMELLKKAPQKSTTDEYVFYFGNALRGIPYVPQTLEVGNKENLVVNLRQLDCTTLVENAMALSLCAKNNKKTFNDFCTYLRQLRYRDGKVSYPSRLHYFTMWIEENTKNGFVGEISAQVAPFTATQTLNINFMSEHPSYYPALAHDAEMVKLISEAEKPFYGKKYRYIPKSKLKDYDLLKKYIKTGDIIAIVTNKAGLDTSHIGIASWHSDGTLHLLNASQIHGKVVDEPMTIYTYMQKHPIQIGIRVIRAK